MVSDRSQGSPAAGSDGIAPFLGLATTGWHDPGPNPPRRRTSPRARFQALGVRESLGRDLGQAAEHDTLKSSGMPGRSRDGGTTGSRACAISTAIPPSPSNGGRPVSRK